MSGVYVDEFTTIVKVVNRALSRLVSREEVIDASGATATVQDIPADGSGARQAVAPVILARRPVSGDRVVVLDAPALGGKVVLGVIATEGDVDVLEDLQDQITALEQRVAALEP